MAEPSTHREALMAELLGDVGMLLDRAEALKASIDAAGNGLSEHVRSAAGASARGVRDITMKSDEAVARFAGLTREIDLAATKVASGSTRMGSYLIAIAVVAGMIGGGLGCLIIARFLHL